MSVFTRQDEASLASRGIPLQEAERQVRCLSEPPRYAALDRPCTPGDGIETPDGREASRLEALHERRVRTGSFCRFIPASGAATRMFQPLLAWLDDPRDPGPAELAADLAAGRPEAVALRAFLDGLDRFPFRAAMEEAAGPELHRLAAVGPFRPLLRALLSSQGLGYAGLPKGLILFHQGEAAPRTAFEEHLEEAARLGPDAGGSARLHVTVSPDHQHAFRRHAVEASSAAGARHGVRLEVAFSVQSPSTDTLAIDGQWLPARTDDGSLLLRPSGHGALLDNLRECGPGVVFLKNIDNVAPDHLKEPGLRWTRILAGRLIEIQETLHTLLRRLEDPGDGRAVDEALLAARELLRREPSPDASSDRRGEARRLLDRPLRVCGMVRNQGEPGGGPYWAGASDGSVTPQIVESAQVDPASPGQKEIFARATHFNPVFMVCSTGDARGALHPLERYADPAAAIVTRKSHRGREILALERPGLWNGGMAFWGTVFVEVPLEVFDPVKSVLDLLRPRHQPGRPAGR
ncbi:MAG TPA: DUF4301 family protein [Candidatus Polarisedimenticolia bacterium]|nr:DUF4301 family protein [Candidatus Polarisedimenticolia bacterium]